MNILNIEVRLEDFICRLPAMFAYLEWNEDGSVETHKATDSPDGCYGKIADNILIPQGVFLTNYIQVLPNEIPSTYVFTEANTVRLSENLKEHFSTNASSYLRHVLWYAYTQIDGEYPDVATVVELPTYVTDEDPEVCKILATDPNGNTIECDSEPLYDYYKKEASYIYYKREEIISSCTTYSYRTIISEYYKYKDIVGKDNPFIRFVDLGIGLVRVDRRLLGLSDEERYSEVPDEIYLSQVRKLLYTYKDYKKAADYYSAHYVANGWNDTVLAEKVAKYERMGGDNMTNWLGQMLQKSYDVADEYLCHSNNKDFPVRFGLDIMLNTKTDIVGLESVDVNEFIPGKRYYDGDLLTYEDKTYICVLDKYDSNSDNNFQYVFKNGNLLELSNDRYIIIDKSNITYVNNSDEIAEGQTTFVCLEGRYYKWDDTTNGYIQIAVVSYCVGVKDEEADRIVFDTQHFVPLSEIEGYSGWYDDTNTNGDKYRFFTDVDYLPSVKLTEYVRLGDSVFAWDEYNSEYVGIEEGIESYMVKERTNSKLRDVRVRKEYLNSFGVAEEPGLNEDWLYFYKVGTITGTDVETDAFGNIIRDGDEYNSGEYCYDMHAYGNVVTSITYDEPSNSLTFEYVIGGHLKAKYVETKLDVDGNPRRLYDNLEWDEDSGVGVRFSETYNCSDDSVVSLGSDFEAYVNGSDVQVNRLNKFKKFPFVTVPVMALNGVSNVEGVGACSVDSRNDLLHANVVREEWMNGLWHQPKVKSSILIDRGNGASFERHLRLGEIHTMEDLQNYHNGGFYQISEN